MARKKSTRKKFKKVKKPDENIDLKAQWISAFEDLDQELEKICEKRDIPKPK